MYVIYRGQKPNGEYKIGCDSDWPNRAIEQNLTNYEVLEEYDDIYEASNREIELQKEYGYRVDRIPYYKILEHSKDSPKFLGKSHTDDFKQLISSVHKGKVTSEETKRKISESMKKTLRAKKEGI